LKNRILIYPLFIFLLVIQVLGLEPSNFPTLNQQSPNLASKTNLEPANLSQPWLCVFDYDLTLSSNKCPQTQNGSQCWTTSSSCPTYNWNTQCLGLAAADAIAECVKRGAYIGIASHANRDACWSDKILPIVAKNQFPALLESEKYATNSGPFAYPQIDNKNNWNCDNCAYHLNSSIDKSTGIKRIMTHYGLDPLKLEDRQRVIFWDDGSANIANVQSQLPGIRAIKVAQLDPQGGNGGGCGVTQADINKGWEGIPVPNFFMQNKPLPGQSLYISTKFPPVLEFQWKENFKGYLEVYTLQGQSLLQTEISGHKGEKVSITLVSPLLKSYKGIIFYRAFQKMDDRALK